MRRFVSLKKYSQFWTRLDDDGGGDWRVWSGDARNWVDQKSKMEGSAIPTILITLTLASSDNLLFFGLLMLITVIWQNYKCS